MKFFLITVVVAILFSSCLKQSIPDAMLNSQNGIQGNITATMSYKVNGDPVNVTVTDANNQDPNYYTLGCTKKTNNYVLDALANTGEFTFEFFTDTLSPGIYYIAGNTYVYVLGYNGTNGYVKSATDSLGFTITSNNKGHISGTFSGKLTPMDPTNSNFGTPSSLIITDGSFQNIPVFY